MDEREVMAGLDEEEQKRLERIAKLDANQKRKKVIFGAVTVALIAMFMAGTVFGAKYILSNEGTQPLPTAAFAPVEETPDSVISEINRLLADTEDFDGVKLDSRFRVSIDRDSVTAEGENASEALLRYVKDAAEETLSDLYSENGHEGGYGEDFTPYLPDFSFSAADVKETAFAPKEDNDGELIATFTFDGCAFDALPGSRVSGIFALEDLPETVRRAEDAFAGSFTVNDLAIDYDDFHIEAFVERDNEDGPETRRGGLTGSTMCGPGTLPLTSPLPAIWRPSGPRRSASGSPAPRSIASAASPSASAPTPTSLKRAIPTRSATGSTPTSPWRTT